MSENNNENLVPQENPLENYPDLCMAHFPFMQKIIHNFIEYERSINLFLQFINSTTQKGKLASMMLAELHDRTIQLLLTDSTIGINLEILFSCMKYLNTHKELKKQIPINPELMNLLNQMRRDFVSSFYPQNLNKKYLIDYSI